MREELSTLVTEEWLRACPTGILVRSGEGELWANPALVQLAGLDGEEIGQPPETPLLKSLLEREGLVSLRLDNGTERWINCTSSQVTSGLGDTLELRFYQDATAQIAGEREREALQHRVQELNLTDPLTGLANRRALGQALAAQVTRSRRYRNPLSVAMVRIEMSEGDTPPPDGVILSVSRFLRERLRWADVIGREEHDCFLLILPETGRDDATALLDAIRADAGQLHQSSPHDALHLRVGVKQWHKGLDGARLVAEARRLLDAERVPDTASSG